MVALAGSISSTPTMRSIDTTTEPGSGRAPPHKPVNPPCGTTARPTAWQAFSVVETSCAFSGRTTASGVTGGWVLQSLQLRAGISAPSSTVLAPRVFCSSAKAAHCGADAVKGKGGFMPKLSCM